MFSINESNPDRIIRVLVGLALLALSLFGVITGALSIVFIVLGIVLLATGILGFCPLYALLKIRTNRA